MKKFLLVFAVVMLLIVPSGSVYAGSESGSLPPVPSHSYDKYFIVDYYHSQTGEFNSTYLFFVKGAADWVLENYLLSDGRRGTVFHSLAPIYKYQLVDGSWVFKETIPGSTGNGAILLLRYNDSFPWLRKIVYSNHDVALSVGGVFFSLTLPPPGLEEVTQESLGSLMMDFGRNLGILLPVGVTVLCLILGMLLILRLVRSWT